MLLLGILILNQVCFCANSFSTQKRPRQPNFVLFFADDLGYGDLSAYGHPTQEYGAVDRMAQQGIRFTQWYSAAPTCTPSRAALLTGRLPVRSGMVGDIVLFPDHHGGLPHKEVTLAESLKQQGYTTGIVGKWHLGINEHRRDDGNFLPHTQGFDYVGTIIPFTLETRCDESKQHRSQPNTEFCFLYHNTTLTQQPINLKNLTSSFVHDAKAFIHESKDRPFFLYYPLAQTHTPMFNAEQFKGKSKRGIYGDQVNEMSWAVGEILDTLKALSLDEDTLAFFVSDHGPHREICSEGGSTAGLRGGKGNFYEGGVRVPALAWWPGTIMPGQVSSSVVSTMDIFSTFIDLAGGKPPKHTVIDGQSISDILLQQKTRHSDSMSRPLFFHDHNKVVMAVRYRQYKIHYNIYPEVHSDNITQFCPNGFPLEDYYRFMETSGPISQVPPLIFNVENDPEEKYPLSVENHRQLLGYVDNLVDEHVGTLESNLQILHPGNRVKSLSPCCNPPYCICNYPIKM